MYWTGWWITGGYNLDQQDRDNGTWGDNLPDPLEPNISANEGGPYDPAKLDAVFGSFA